MKKLLLLFLFVSNCISMFATQGPITLQVWGGIDHDEKKWNKDLKWADGLCQFQVTKTLSLVV